MATTHWHLLQVRVGKEFDLAEMLTWMGLRTYTPQSRVWKKVGRSSIKIKQVEALRAAFAGYVFVGIVRGALDWMAVDQLGLIRGVLCVADQPFRFSPASIARIAMRQRDGAFSARKHMPNVKAGDVVRVTDEEHFLWARELIVQSVKDGAAYAEINLLNQSTIVPIPLDALERRSIDAKTKGGCGSQGPQGGEPSTTTRRRDGGTEFATNRTLREGGKTSKI